MTPLQIQNRHHVQGSARCRTAQSRALHLWPKGVILPFVDHHQIVVEQQPGHPKFRAVDCTPVERKAGFREGTVCNGDGSVKPVVEIDDLVLVQQLSGHRQWSIPGEKGHHAVRVLEIIDLFRIANRGIRERDNRPAFRALFEIFGVDAIGGGLLGLSRWTAVAPRHAKQSRSKEQKSKPAACRHKRHFVGQRLVENDGTESPSKVFQLLPLALVHLDRTMLHRAPATGSFLLHVSPV